MIISVISGFSICIGYRLETIDNIDSLSQKILLETRIIRKFECLLYEGNLSDFMIDEMTVEVIGGDNEYVLFYNGMKMRLIIDNTKIISVEYS